MWQWIIVRLGRVEVSTIAKEGAEGGRTWGAISLGNFRRETGAGAAGEANSACQSNSMAASRLINRTRNEICCEKKACEEEGSQKNEWNGIHKCTKREFHKWKTWIQHTWINQKTAPIGLVLTFLNWNGWRHAIPHHKLAPHVNTTNMWWSDANLVSALLLGANPSRAKSSITNHARCNHDYLFQRHNNNTI